MKWRWAPGAGDNACNTRPLIGLAVLICLTSMPSTGAVQLRSEMWRGHKPGDTYLAMPQVTCEEHPGLCVRHWWQVDGTPFPLDDPGYTRIFIQWEDIPPSAERGCPWRQPWAYPCSENIIGTTGYATPVKYGAASGSQFVAGGGYISGRLCLYAGHGKSTKMQTLICGNMVDPSEPEKCTVNDNAPLNVTYGSIDRGDIPLTAGAVHRDTVLRFTCEGSTPKSFLAALSGSSASWSDGALQSSTPPVAVAMTWNGEPIRPGDTKAIMVNGSTTIPLGFDLIRNPSVPVDQIAVGGFSASATLIVTEM